jgi:hypothetical protein
VNYREALYTALITDQLGDVSGDDRLSGGVNIHSFVCLVFLITHHLWGFPFFFVPLHGTLIIRGPCGKPKNVMLDASCTTNLKRIPCCFAPNYPRAILFFRHQRLALSTHLFGLFTAAANLFLSLAQPLQNRKYNFSSFAKKKPNIENFNWLTVCLNPLLTRQSKKRHRICVSCHIIGKRL